MGHFLFHGQVEKDQKKGEDDAVDHAGDSNGGVVTKNPFFVDREVEENYTRDRREEEAQEAERVLEHGDGDWVMAI